MKHTESLTSCLHTHVRFHVYEPRVIIRIKGVVQIHHGLFEHADRYDHFATYLSNSGYVVVVSDFVGHGKSLIDFEQGFFGMNNGSEGLVKDMFHLYEIMRERYQEAPYYLLGVDLGALIIRKFMSTYGEYIQGVLLLGSSGDTKKLALAKYQIKFLKMFKGPLHRSKLLFNYFYSKNSKKIKVLNKLEWYTSDENQRRVYLEDPMTHFVYTLKGYEDILLTLKEVNSQISIREIPTFLSIYIGVGSDDTLTIDSYKIYEKYKEHGVRDLTFKKFDGFRHGLLFEKDKSIVYKSILNWLDERTYI